MNRTADAASQFGARLSYFVPRESDDLIQAQAKESRITPRVRKASLKDQMAARIKDFQNIAELVAMLEGKRSLDKQMLRRMQAEEHTGEQNATRTVAGAAARMADLAEAGRAAPTARTKGFGRSAASSNQGPPSTQALQSTIVVDVPGPRKMKRLRRAREEEPGAQGEIPKWRAPADRV